MLIRGTRIVMNKKATDRYGITQEGMEGIIIEPIESYWHDEGQEYDVDFGELGIYDVNSEYFYVKKPKFLRRKTDGN